MPSVARTLLTLCRFACWRRPAATTCAELPSPGGRLTPADTSPLDTVTAPRTSAAATSVTVPCPTVITQLALRVVHGRDRLHDPGHASRGSRVRTACRPSPVRASPGSSNGCRIGNDLVGAAVVQVDDLHFLRERRRDRTAATTGRRRLPPVSTPAIQDIALGAGFNPAAEKTIRFGHDRTVGEGIGMILLETGRLRLRRFDADDLDRLVELDSDPEVMRYITYGVPTPRATYEDVILPRWFAIYAQTPGTRLLGGGGRATAASSSAGSTCGRTGSTRASRNSATASRVPPGGAASRPKARWPWSSTASRASAATEDHGAHARGQPALAARDAKMRARLRVRLRLSRGRDPGARARPSAPRSSTRSRALSWLARQRLRKRSQFARPSSPSGRPRADLGRARAQLLDDLRAIAVLAPVEQLGAQLVEPHPRALVERVRRVVEFADHLRARPTRSPSRRRASSRAGRRGSCSPTGSAWPGPAAPA